MCRIMEKRGKASAESQVTNIEPQEKAEITFQWSFHSCPPSLERMGSPNQKDRLSNMTKVDTEAVKRLSRCQVQPRMSALTDETTEPFLRDKPHRSKRLTTEIAHFNSSTTDTNTCLFCFCFKTFLWEISKILSRTIVPFQLKYSRC